MEPRELLQLVVILSIVPILMGTIFLTGLGTLANGTIGNACKNCQGTTKTMLNTSELALPLAVFIAIIGAVVTTAFVIARHKGR